MFIATMPPKNEALIAAGYIKDIHKEYDPWKLQKLSYFSEAWKLAWVGTSLFNNPVEAWRDGPVVRDVYREYRYSKLPNTDWSSLSVLDKEIIGSVLEFYGDFTRQELIDISHEDEPWKKARIGLDPRGHGQELIDKSDLRKFYMRKSIFGEDGPIVPSIAVHTPTVEEIQGVGAAQEVRWKDTLDWLSTR